MMASFTSNFAVIAVLLVLEANGPEGGFQEHDVFGRLHGLWLFRRGDRLLRYLCYRRGRVNILPIVHRFCCARRRLAGVCALGLGALRVGFAGALLFQVLPVPARMTSDGLWRSRHTMANTSAKSAAVRISFPISPDQRDWTTALTERAPK